MNTDMRAVLYPTPGQGQADLTTALSHAEAMARSFEARFSRFLPSSELSLVNRSGGRWMRLSPDMAEVLGLAREFHTETGGLFDPGMLPRLEQAGYDRSFETISAGKSAVMAEEPATPGFRAVEFDGPDLVRLPAGCRLDLGGIVKGWAADQLADRLAPFGAALVDLGGDIAVRGTLPDGASWCIGVERPDRPGELLTVLEVPAGGGVATSGTNRRRWRIGGQWMHHLIDPRTGGPACTDLLQVVVLDTSTARADVWAKTAVILGTEGCRHLLARRPELHLLLISADGSTVATPGVGLGGGKPQRAA